MTEEEEVFQRKKNLEAFSDFMRCLGESMGGADESTE
jgi:hypothetical protein